LKFAAVALNAEGAEVLAEDAKAIIFLCDLCEILRVLCVETPSCEGKDLPEVFTGFANSESNLVLRIKIKIRKQTEHISRS